MAGHLRRLAQVASTPFLAPEAVKQAPQPATATKPARQFAELAGLFDVATCIRTLYVRRSQAFTFFLPVCEQHAWVGQESMCEFDAGAQICQHHVHALIAASRAERAEREGYVRFDGE